MGACYARNKAIKNAKGLFITGLDDDDYFLPHRIEYLINNYSNKYIFICDSSSNSKKFNQEITLTDVLEKNIIGNQVFAKVTSLYRIKGFDEKLPAWQDYDTWIRLLKIGYKGLKLPERTMVIDDHHSKDRISKNYKKIIIAYGIFIEKHHDLYAKNQTTLLTRKINTCSFYSLKCSLTIKDLLLLSYKLKIKSLTKYLIILIDRKPRKKNSLNDTYLLCTSNTALYMDNSQAIKSFFSSFLYNFSIYFIYLHRFSSNKH